MNGRTKRACTTASIYQQVRKHPVNSNNAKDFEDANSSHKLQRRLVAPKEVRVSLSRSPLIREEDGKNREDVHKRLPLEPEVNVVSRERKAEPEVREMCSFSLEKMCTRET